MRVQSFERFCVIIEQRNYPICIRHGSEGQRLLLGLSLDALHQLRQGAQGIGLLGVSGASSGG